MWRFASSSRLFTALLIAAAAAVSIVGATAPHARTSETLNAVPAPTLVQRPQRPAKPSAAEAQVERLRLLNSTKSWGYQLANLKVEEAARAPFDLLVVDATTGLESEGPFKPTEVRQLKRKPDGSRRILVSYLSVGEAEDYRPEYFDKEYMSEDPPEWLMHENKDWKGNRIVRFCHEGWQKLILGDANGRDVHSETQPSPLYRLIELGFDGVYLDRVDVYEEVGKECPDAARKMVDFIARLAAHARKRNPHFMVILQNAEDLLKHARMVEAIDAVAKEGLFHTWMTGVVPAATTQWSLERLAIARKAGRPVFVVDYPANRAAADLSVRRIREQGYVPYIGPKALDRLFFPGANF
jgi:cysteinyl-tRNA synthetase